MEVHVIHYINEKINIKDYKKWLINKKNFISSFKIIENGNYDIILIEECPCQNNEQLRKKEREWIEKIDCINIDKKPYSSMEEQKEYFKNWKINNIEQYNIKQKEYRLKNKEKLKEKKYLYWINNKDKIKEYKKEYYLNNIDKLKELKEKKTKKIECSICNSIVSKRHLVSHQQSNYCKSLLEKNKNEIIINNNKIECPICHSLVYNRKDNLTRHQKSIKCQKIKSNINV